MNSKIYLLAALLFLLCLPVSSISSVDSFEGLAQLHCKESPVELIYRLATGQLAEVYGAGFKDLDCYVRQFVNKGTHLSIQMVKTSLKKRRRTKKTKKIRNKKNLKNNK